MTIKLSIRLGGDAAGFVERLRLKAARGLEPYAGPLTDAVHKFWADRFESQGELGGTSRWPDLRPETVRRHGAHPVLEMTGSLWASLTQGGSVSGGYGEASRTWGYALLEDDGWTLRIGTTDPVTALINARRPVAPDEVPPAYGEAWAALIDDRMLEDL